MRGVAMSRLVVFYLIAFAWSWGIWWPAVYFESGAWQVPEWLPPAFSSGSMAAWGPLIGAILVSLMYQGWAGLCDLAHRMLKARIGLKWWAVALLMLPALLGVTWVIAGALGADIPPSQAFAEPISIPFAFVWILFLGGPLQEEAGWRGIATDDLQNKVSRIVAALVVGALWGLWHLPLFQLPSAGIYYDQPFWGLFLSTMFLAVILSWIYNRTGGSLLAAMILHTSFNWANFLFPVLETDLGGQIYFAGLILICGAILWRDGLSLGRD